MIYEVGVGTVLKVKNGFLKGTFKIMYCGMSNEHTFVLAPFVSFGYQGFCPNIFYNSNASIIHIYKKEFYVIEVTPEYIVLED